MAKRISKRHEEKLINSHIFIEKGKFFAGLIIIGILLVLIIVNAFFDLNLPNNFYLGFIAGALITASSKIKEYKDILSLK